MRRLLPPRLMWTMRIVKRKKRMAPAGLELRVTWMGRYVFFLVAAFLCCHSSYLPAMFFIQQDATDDSDVVSVPPSSVTSSPKKKVRVQEVVETVRSLCSYMNVC